MSELKTLKDIKLSYDYDTDCNLKEELKAEAVKWVKKWQNKSWTSNPEPAEAFIDFFNITEEDLK